MDAAAQQLLVSTDNGFSNGTDTITATYSGDSNFSPSSSTATVTVSAARFATTIIANNADQATRWSLWLRAARCH